MPIPHGRMDKGEFRGDRGLQHVRSAGRAFRRSTRLPQRYARDGTVLLRSAAKEVRRFGPRPPPLRECALRHQLDLDPTGQEGALEGVAAHHARAAGPGDPVRDDQPAQPVAVVPAVVGDDLELPAAGRQQRLDGPVGYGPHGPKPPSEAPSEMSRTASAAPPTTLSTEAPNGHARPVAGMPAQAKVDGGGWAAAPPSRDVGPPPDGPAGSRG